MSSDETVSLQEKKAMVRTRFGVVVVLACVIFLCPFGSIASEGNMAPYVISYTRARSLDPSRKWVEMGSAAFLYGTIGVFEGLSVPLAGWVLGRIGPRPTAAIAASIFTAANLLTAPALKLSFWAVLIISKVAMGVSLGFVLVTVVYAATQWMPQHKGLAIGVAMTGLGGSSVVFIPIQTAFVNPSNEAPNPYFTQPHLLDRVPHVYLVLSAIYGVLLLISIPFIVGYRDVEPPSKSPHSIMKYVWLVVKPQWPNCRHGLSLCRTPWLSIKAALQKETTKLSKQKAPVVNPLCNDDGKSKKKSDSGTSELSSEEQTPELVNKKNIKPLELVKRWDFHLVWLAHFTQRVYIVCLMSLYKNFGESAAFDDHSLALIGSLAALSNCVGRVLWGLMADYIPCKVVFVLIFCGMTSFMYTFYATQFASVWIYGLWVCVMLFCLGGCYVVFPVGILSWYGPKYFGTNYGIGLTSTSISNIAGIALSFTAHLALGWSGLFLVTGSVCFLGMVLLIFGAERPMQ